LDSLYNVLKNPAQYGDKFLVQIVSASKDGLVSLSLLRNMATVLNEYPLEYLAYCIPIDKQARFYYNSHLSRVGLKEHAEYFETDPYGFVKQEGVDNQYLEVQPVIFNNGRFYIDNEHSRAQTQDGKQLYEYDVLDMEPLGKRQSENDTYLVYDSQACFNCGESGHAYQHCPLPKDNARIAKKRREHVSVPPKDLAKEHGFKPGQLSEKLKEALGIKDNNQEPPYYKHMRYFGFPPGYLTREPEILKIYDGDGNEVRNDEEGFIPKEELIEYPGLNIHDDSGQVEYNQQLKEWETYQQKQWEEYQNWLYYYPYSQDTQSTQKPQLTSDDHSVDMDISSEDED
ncbi:Zinc finger CCHC domain-containing protein 8, partial [Rhizopus stolonifer]